MADKLQNIPLRGVFCFILFIILLTQTDPLTALESQAAPPSTTLESLPPPPVPLPPLPPPPVVDDQKTTETPLPVIPQPLPNELQASRLYWALINNDLLKIWQEIQVPGTANLSMPIGGSPVLVAAMAGHREALKLLMENGADLKRAADQYGVPLLTRLELEGQRETVWTLMGLGASWRKSVLDGSTGVHVAALWPTTDAAQDMIGWGFNPLAADDNGRTPLMVAARAGNLPLVEFFLYQEADPLDIDIFGHTAVDLARWMEQEDVVQLLETVMLK